MFSQILIVIALVSIFQSIFYLMAYGYDNKLTIFSTCGALCWFMISFSIVILMGSTYLPWLKFALILDYLQIFMATVLKLIERKKNMHDTVQDYWKHDNT